MKRILFKNGNIFTPRDRGVPLAGKRQGELFHIPNGAVLVKDGIIEDIGDGAALGARLTNTIIDVEVDCEGKCVVPGLVDPHTHMCFTRLREEEFSLRLAGTPYLEILAGGGGILSSVRDVAAADLEELTASTRKRLLTALSLGTTTVEVKSGYGLDLENELKMIEATQAAAQSVSMDVVITFLGAHAIPEAYRGKSDAFIDHIISEMLPVVKKQGIATQCDIFCEKGVFTIEQGRRLLSAARDMGFGIKLHADEVHDLGGAGLAAELQALSADHLLAAGEKNIEAMAAANVVATLLPATAYSLKKNYGAARRMIAKGVPVALATDCNPGSSYTESLPFVIGLGVMKMDMTPEEALNAATLNSAYAIGAEEKVGSLDVGKQADLLLLEGNSPAILPYHAGVSSVATVYKRGVRVVP